MSIGKKIKISKSDVHHVHRNRDYTVHRMSTGARPHKKKRLWNLTQKNFENPKRCSHTNFDGESARWNLIFKRSWYISSRKSIKIYKTKKQKVFTLNKLTNIIKALNSMFKKKHPTRLNFNLQAFVFVSYVLYSSFLGIWGSFSHFLIRFSIFFQDIHFLYSFLSFWMSTIHRAILPSWTSLGIFKNFLGQVALSVSFFYMSCPSLKRAEKRCRNLTSTLEIVLYLWYKRQNYNKNAKSIYFE